MTGSPPLLDQRELLANSDRLRRLAQRLCGDPHLAEDLTQGTLTALVETAARPPAQPIGWMRGVLRNLWRQHRRREGVRREREGLAAQATTLPSTAATVAQVEMQRRVADAVLALPEPERSAVLWRFFHDVSARVIATRLGVHEDTVHDRIRRGLDRLRDELGSDDDDRRALALLATAPLATPMTATPTAATRTLNTPLGVLLLNAKSIAIVAAAAALVSVLCWTAWPDDAPPPPPDDSTATASASASTSPDTTTAASQLDRSTAPAPTPTNARPDPATPNEIEITGLAYDAAGQPLADVTLRSNAGSTTTESGRFTLQCVRPADRVVVDDPDWITVYAGRVDAATDASAPTPVVVVAARRATVSGLVVDEDRMPQRGTHVRLVPPKGFLTTFAMPLDQSEPAFGEWQTQTGEAGTFELRDIGLLKGLRAMARAPGYLPALADVSATPTAVELVLQRPSADADAVLGHVIDPLGAPVAGAMVCLGPSRSRTDAEGRFRVDHTKRKDHTTIQAMHRGYLPASAPLPAAAGDRPVFVELQLPGVTRSLAGRLVDRNGAAVAGARVWVDGATAFRGGMWQVEAYLGGGATNAELRARADDSASLLELQERHPTAFWGWTRTAADGSFELTGLLEQDYELGILAGDGMHRGRAGPFSAGSTGLVVTFAPNVHEVVAGKVVGIDGSPRAGIAVEACCRVFHRQFDADGSSRSAVRHGPVVTTDAAGRFRFENLGADGLFLAINGTAIVDRVAGMADGALAGAGLGPITDLAIPVADRTHLRVELADRQLADSFRVVDAEENALPLANFEDGGMTVHHAGTLHDGRSRVYAVAGTAAAVILQRAGADVRRVPVRLVSGEVVTVRG